MDSGDQNAQQRTARKMKKLKSGGDFWTPYTT